VRTLVWPPAAVVIADPHQLRNVAARAAYADIRRGLRERVERWMRETGDPRVDTTYDGWDEMTYFGPPLRSAEGASKQNKASRRK
jgi:hypothetical protein